MKKIVVILLSCVLCTTLLIGCGKGKNSNENSSESSMLTQSEKDSYKTKVENALKGFNVSNIDILTQNKTKKPIISLQINFNGIKGKVNKKDVQKLVNEIEKNIKPISELYDITIIDKNNQIIAIARNDDNRKVEFME